MICPSAYRETVIGSWGNGNLCLGLCQSLYQLSCADYLAVSPTKVGHWMIMEVGWQGLASFKPVRNGADEENAKGMLAAKGGELGKLVGWGAFDDVYIVAILVCYAPLGVVLLLATFY